MVQSSSLADPSFDVAEKIGGGALLGLGCGTPVFARPAANAYLAIDGRPLEQEQLLRLALTTADEELERLARGRAAEIDRRHRTSTRSATMRPKSSARYSSENLYNDHAAGIHCLPRATRMTPSTKAPLRSRAPAR